jgi:hypothetical protein
VAHQVEGRGGLLAGSPQRLERAGQGDVVDVVTGRLGEGALLPPAGHAGINEAGVALETDVRSEAQTFHHAGSEALEERVRALDQAQCGRDRVGVLEVEGHAAATAIEEVARRRGGMAFRHRLGSIDAEHLGAHVGQHHGGERARPDARELENPDATQGSHARSSSGSS